MAKRYTYIGKGTIYLGPYAQDAAKRSVGNASRLELTVEAEEKELLDFQNPGGGKANQINRITGVQLAMTLHEISPENLAAAAFGSAAAVAGGAVSGEAHTAYKGGLVRFAKLPDLAEAITVTDGDLTTYEEGDDYILTRAGIVITHEGAIADEQGIEVSYTARPSNVVQALTQAAQEWKLTFDGLNEAESGRPVVVDVHRIKFSPLQNLGLIADEFAGLEMTGESLSDEAVTGAGLSKFFTVEMAE